MVEYGPDGVNIARMDGGLQERGPREGTLEVIRSILSQELSDEPFGTHEASVHRFRDVLVVHRPDGQGGVIATYDESAASKPLEDLLAEVRSI